jgi:hypothetical protein
MTVNITSEPYVNECSTKIPWFTSDQSRIKFRGIEVDDSEEVQFYKYSKDSDPLNDSSITVKEGDVWIQTDNSNIGYIYHDDGTGTKSWVQAQWYWERSAFVSYSASFLNVYTSGFPSYYGNANGSYGVCPCFSI